MKKLMFCLTVIILAGCSSIPKENIKVVPTKFCGSNYIALVNDEAFSLPVLKNLPDYKKVEYINALMPEEMNGKHIEYFNYTFDTSDNYIFTDVPWYWLVSEDGKHMLTHYILEDGRMLQIGYLLKSKK